MDRLLEFLRILSSNRILCRGVRRGKKKRLRVGWLLQSTGGGNGFVRRSVFVVLYGTLLIWLYRMNGEEEEGEWEGENDEWRKVD